MRDSYEFLKRIMDSITEHIVVIDENGAIQFINKAWDLFSQQNAYPGVDWRNVNYLEVCDHSASMGDELGAQAAEGIRQVMRGELEVFYLEYPCHSPEEQRWFMMRVTPLLWAGESFFVISHQNITERKRAEEEALNLSLTDGLTNLPNRRHFDEFLNAEWRRSTRKQLPISLLMIDIDDFKHLNDQYGHQAGDDCVIVIGAVLKSFCKRPGDLLARYGGDEFAVVLGNTSLEQSLEIAHRMVQGIQDLHIINPVSPRRSVVTVSIGIAAEQPQKTSKLEALIAQADSALYEAKRSGKNAVVHNVRAAPTKPA